MIDLRINKYLVEKGLNIAEFYLLYNIMVSKTKLSQATVGSNEDVLIEAGKYFVQYIKNNKTYLNTEISNIQMLEDLEKRGFVEIWTKDRTTIDIMKIEITSKFTDDFYETDMDKVFKQFLKLYPKKGLSNNSTWMAMDKPYDELKSIFVKMVKGGDKLAIMRFFMVTEVYFNDIGYNYAPYKISRYFELFENIALSYETGDSNKGNSGRRKV